MLKSDISPRNIIINNNVWFHTNSFCKTIKEYFEHLQEVKERLKNNPSIEDKKKIIKEFNEFKETHKKNTNKFVGLKYMTDVFKKKTYKFFRYINNWI